MKPRDGQAIMIGQHLRDARLKKCLTQARLAQVVDVHISRICGIENGRKSFGLETAEKIDLHLGTTLKDFWQARPTRKRRKTAADYQDEIKRRERCCVCLSRRCKLHNRLKVLRFDDLEATMRRYVPQVGGNADQPDGHCQLRSLEMREDHSRFMEMAKHPIRTVGILLFGITCPDNPSGTAYKISEIARIWKISYARARHLAGKAKRIMDECSMQATGD